MTTEQNEPVSSPNGASDRGFEAIFESAAGSASDPAADLNRSPGATNGQAAGQATAQQRRRRRRRKANKGFAQAPPLASGVANDSTNGQSAPAAEIPVDAPTPPSSAANGQNGQHRQHSQKKARPQGGAANGNGSHAGAQNGQPRNFQKNSGMGNGGQQQGTRRKNKQRRQASTFVGPMDHSYRVVNGNVADGGAGEYRSSYRSDRDLPNGNIAARNSYLDPSETPAVIREDAPTRILCFIEDLFVVAKLQETAKKLGVKVGFLKAEKDTVTRLTDTPENERPSLIVFDLNNANAKPLVLIPKLKAKLKRGTSVIGFLSHIQGDLKVKAIEAGCDMVMPKSAFSQNLPNLLRRHGLEEEELEAVEA